MQRTWWYHVNYFFYVVHAYVSQSIINVIIIISIIIFYGVTKFVTLFIHVSWQHPKSSEAHLRQPTPKLSFLCAFNLKSSIIIIYIIINIYTSKFVYLYF